MQKVASSFRDRSGYVVEHEHQFYRTVHASYQSHYDQLMSSGLYQELVTKHDLIAHEEVPELAASWQTYKVLKPEQLHFISYAAEWSFTMLQDAALCTLRIALAGTMKGPAVFDMMVLLGKNVAVARLQKAFDHFDQAI